MKKGRTLLSYIVNSRVYHILTVLTAANLGKLAMLNLALKMISTVCYFLLEFQKSAPSINRLFSLSLHPFAIFISIFHLCSWSDNLYATWNLKPLQSSIGDCCCCFTFSTLLALQFSSRSSTISFSRSLLFFGRDYLLEIPQFFTEIFKCEFPTKKGTLCVSNLHSFAR